MRFVVGTGVTLLARILGFVASVASGLLLARLLGPELRGEYALIVLIPGLMMVLGNLGIDVANVYFVGARRYAVEEVISNSLWCAAGLGCCCIFAFVGLSRVLDLHFLRSIPFLFLLLPVLALPLWLLGSFLNAVLQGRELFVQMNIVHLGFSLSQLLGLLFLLVLFPLGLLGAVVAWIVGVIVFFVLSSYFVSRLISSKLTFRITVFRDSLRFGIQAYFTTVCGFLSYRLDMFLVAHFLDKTEVGYYAVAVGLAELLWYLSHSAATVLIPRVAGLASSKADEMTSMVGRHVLILTLVSGLVLLVVGRPVVLWGFGTAYESCLRPLYLLLPGVVALSLGRIFSGYFAGRGMPKFSLFSTLLALVLNVCLNLILIPRWGLAGAAVASSVAYTLATVSSLYFFLRTSSATIEDVLLPRWSDIAAYVRWIKRM